MFRLGTGATTTTPPSQQLLSFDFFDSATLKFRAILLILTGWAYQIKFLMAYSLNIPSIAVSYLQQIIPNFLFCRILFYNQHLQIFYCKECYASVKKHRPVTEKCLKKRSLSQKNAWEKTKNTLLDGFRNYFGRPQ